VQKEIIKSLTVANSLIFEIFYNLTDNQVSSRTTEQIYKRTNFTHTVKMYYFLVILKEIILAFIT